MTIPYIARGTCSQARHGIWSCSSESVICLSVASGGVVLYSQGSKKPGFLGVPGGPPPGPGPESSVREWRLRKRDFRDLDCSD